MRRLSQLRYLAAALHALLFITAWSLYAVSGQPMMNGLSALPFFVLLVADLPISIVASSMLFSSTTYGPLAIFAWAVAGTYWWYVLGRSIERRLNRRKQRIQESALYRTDSDAVTSADTPAWGNWGIWFFGSCALLAILLIAFTWAQRASEKALGGEISDLALSPDGQSVVISRSGPESRFLYRVSLPSGTAVRLTSASSGFETSPSYSPDGKRIAFAYTANRDEHSRIFVMDANGGNVQSLFPSNENAEDVFPKFAPNGSIYFARSAYFGHYSPIAQPGHHEWALFSVDIDRKIPQQLTNQRFYEMSEPSLSADGKKLLFSVETSTGSQMQLYSLTSNAGPAILQPHVPNHYGSPIYAGAILTPDGGNIVFLAASQGQKAFDYDVYRLNLLTSAIEKLTTANGYATNLCLSSDSKTAAFLPWSSKTGSNPSISRMYLLDLTSRVLSPLPITGSR